MRYYIENFNRYGSLLKAGRAKLYLKKLSFSTEWYFFNQAKSNFSFKFEFGHGEGDDGIMFHAAIPFLFSIFVSLDGIFGKYFRYPNEPRETGISFHDGSLWIYPFSKAHSWSSQDKWWNKYIHFNISEFFCGRNKYSEEPNVDWSDIEITMPEGKYKGKMRLYTGVWKNRFFTKRIPRGEIEMYEGIPFPGKGENSWDCGEDASFGLTCPANTEEELICSMIEHVLRCRRKYGCKKYMFNYIPNKKYINPNFSSPPQIEWA